MEFHCHLSPTKSEFLPNHITLFDLAVDPPALWDKQRERVNGGGQTPCD